MVAIYDIYNPTKAGRVIYDGVEGRQSKIQLAPGQLKRGVELEDHIAAGFGDGRDGDRTDLWVTPAQPDLANPFVQTRAPAQDPVYCPHCGMDIHAPPIMEAEIPAEPSASSIGTTAELRDEGNAPAIPAMPPGFRYQAPPIYAKETTERIGDISVTRRTEHFEKPPKRRKTKKSKAKGKRRARSEPEPETDPGNLDAA